MILDKLLEFADAFALATSAGTEVIAPVVDLQTAGRNMGNGNNVYIVVTVDTEIVGTTDATGTLQIQLVTDTAAALTSAPVVLAASTIWNSDLVGNHLLPAGKVLWCQELPNTENYKRYLGIKVVTATRALTAGKINAFLTTDPASWSALPDGL